MDYFDITLRAMEKLLSDCNEDRYAAYISECVGRWEKSRDIMYLLKGFSENGLFAEFAFQDTVFASDEKSYWTQQLFGGLTAMAIQLARFYREGKNIDIAFIRKNFGFPAQVIEGSVCEGCGARQINAADIDRYISTQVISGAVADGLEAGDLTKTVEQIMNVTYTDITVGRERAKLRAANTGVDVSSARKPATFCMRCGSGKIKSCRFLKSLKKPEFVPLSV